MAAEAPTQPAERSVLRWVVRGVAVLAAGAFLALLGYGLVTKDANTTIDDSLAKAKPVAAPHIDLPVLQRGSGAGGPAFARAAADGRVNLRELRGSPVILNFWASWCLPCRDESPALQRFWAAQRRSGLVVLGLDQQDITGDARDFIRQFRLTYPMIRDGGDDTAHRYGTTGIPETFFISRNGDVVGHVIGAVSATQLRDGAAAAQAGRPLGVESGGARKKT